MPQHLKPFHANINFNAHHSPMGAFFSFTCGHFGTRGGLGVQAGRPGNQDLYIGVKDGDRYASTPLRCLPFWEGADKGAQAAVPEVQAQANAAASNFLVEQADPDLADPDAEKKKPKVLALAAAQIKRHYGWATDAWKTADFEFSIHTPFGEIPDPATSAASRVRDALLPAVSARLLVDNSTGKQTKTGFFSLALHDPGARMIDAGLGAGRIGFALRNHTGVAGFVRDAATGTPVPAFGFMRWSPNDGIADKDNPIHLLGNCPGIGFEVPPGKKYELVLAFGVFLEGVVTSRLEASYYYTRYYANLNDVLDTCLNRADAIAKSAADLDAQLLATDLNPDQQFLLAHATRSYYGSTQLLDTAGQPYWIVNEGEYVMINTLDLSIDHLFWELRYNPWVIRNLLDNFVRFYAYHDQIKDPKTGRLLPGGLSFCHDQGIHNQFSPLGTSSYELTNLHGCFSHMTMEQLCNWSIIAATYVAKTRDTRWAQQNAGVIKACLQSMQRRCPRGVMEFDSSRCGTGQEITTYDSLDASLGQARNNLYLAVKGLATFEGLRLLLASLGESALADQAAVACESAAKTVTAQLRTDGFIPAVFEPENAGYTSKILPAIEGLAYLHYWKQCGAPTAILDAAPESAHGKHLAALRRHTVTLLADKTPGLNRFADGGVKLSSTSNNSWVSKIAIFEHVARELFNLTEHGAQRTDRRGPAGWETSDLAHTRWQTEGSSAYWACSDQMVKGIAIGSKYYPRIVTAVLWLK